MSFEVTVWAFKFLFGVMNLEVFPFKQFSKYKSDWSMGLTNGSRGRKMKTPLSRSMEAPT